MSNNYFCIHQLDRLRSSEVYAYGLWSQVMERGTKAYVECRTEAVQIYIGAAIDICLVRMECPVAKIFAAKHVTKPIEFLVQVYILADEFNRALSLLEKLNNHVIQTGHGNSVEYGSAEFKRFLQCQYRAIERAEQEYFHTPYRASSRYAVQANGAPNTHRSRLTFH